MSDADRLLFSDAELTLMAFIMDRPYFPGAAPPTLDDDGWKAVERGLIARGAVHGRFRQSVADDVAAVLEIVFSAERSLLTTYTYIAGEGKSHGCVLWISADAVLRQWAPPVGPYHLEVCGQAGIDAMLAEVVDFPTAAASQPGPVQTLSLLDFAEAMQVGSRESPAAAAAQFPEASGFIAALADARYSPTVESRVPLGGDLDRREMLTFAESRVHGLWLAHDDPYVGENVGGLVTHMQRVSPDMARAAATALVNGPG